MKFATLQLCYSYIMLVRSITNFLVICLNGMHKMITPWLLRQECFSIEMSGKWENLGFHLLVMEDPSLPPIWISGLVFTISVGRLIWGLIGFYLRVMNHLFQDPQIETLLEHPVFS